jgi:HK97 family phage major capsid protein
MRRDDIRRLTEQRKSVFAQMTKLNETAEHENRSLNTEESEKFDKMATEFEELREREERAARLFIQEREVEKTSSTPLEKRIGDDGDAPATFGEFREQRSGRPAYDEPEVRAAYWRYMTVGSLADLDVEEQRALSRATGAAGNFLVPTDFYNQIIRAQRFMGNFANLATEIVTDGGDTIQVPTNTAHGVATWTSENSSYTPSDETFAQLSLAAYKLTNKIIVSEELLQDSAFALDAYLATEFGERFGVAENTAFIKGDGTAKPTGILASNTASNLGSDVTAAAGNTTSFTYSALVTAIFSLPKQYRNNASFIVNDAAARNLYLMVDTQNRPLWNVNVATTGPDTFLGYPIYTDPDMPAPAIGNISMVFGDWRQGVHDPPGARVQHAAPERIALRQWSNRV